MLGGRQADDHVFGILLRVKRLIAVVLSPVTVEGFRDSGGDEEHPVEVRAGFAKRFACCEAFCDGLAVLIPLEINVKIATLATTVVCRYKQVRALRDIFPVFPLSADKEVFIGQEPGIFKPLL